MSKSTISTFELFQMFPDQEAARLYFEGQRWPECMVCPACGEHERIWNDAKRPGYYRCNADLLIFTVRTETIFERSKIPLHKWLYAMHLLVTSRKGISSLQLAKQIGVTQKSAWFMLQRLREACGNDPTNQAGIALDVITAAVLSYRPAEKGLAAAKIASRVKREKKAEGQDDRALGPRGL